MTPQKLVDEIVQRTSTPTVVDTDRLAQLRMSGEGFANYHAERVHLGHGKIHVRAETFCRSVVDDALHACGIELPTSETAGDSRADWHAIGDEAFTRPFGAIRMCRHCGCLVAGGPTACVRCVKAIETASKTAGEVTP